MLGGDDEPVTGRHGYEIPPAEGTVGKTEKKRFAVAFLTSFAILVLVFFLTFSVLNVAALSLSGVGGFALDVDEMQGTSIDFYPEPVETAACPADFDNPYVVDESEEGLVALTAAVDDIQIPADSQLTLTKDIRTPEILDLEMIRVEVRRGDIIDDPVYPPQASRSDVPSVGDVPQSYLDMVDFNELFVFTDSSDGYADLRFERTAPVIDGEGPYEIDVGPHGYFDYSDADREVYPGSSGLRLDRYLEGVSLQELETQDTGPEGGYEDYTYLNNTMEPPADDTALLLRGESHEMSVTAVGSDPLYGSLTDVRDDPAVEAEVPDPIYGDDSDEAYIDDVVFDYLIDDSGTGDDGGYRGAWDTVTDYRMPKGSFYSMEVTGNKKTGSFTESSNPYGHPCRGDDCLESENGPLYTWTEWQGLEGMSADDDFWVNSGDTGGWADYTDFDSHGDFVSEPDLVEIGGDYWVGMCVNADNTDDDQYGAISIGQVFIDWNDDGEFDESHVMDVAVAANIDDGGESVQECTTRHLRAPEDIEPGTGMIRYYVAGGWAGEDDERIPPTEWDGDDCPDDACTGEAVDYTIQVQEPSEVTAFFDWNQDGAFEDSQEIGSTLDRSGSFEYDELVAVPPHAKSGSTAMRVVHWNQEGDIDPLQDDYVGETHDYTVEVMDEFTQSEVDAYFDWSRDGEFDDVQNIGSEEDNVGEFTVTGDVEVPEDAQAGSSLMRVVHQQDGFGDDGDFGVDDLDVLHEEEIELEDGFQSVDLGGVEGFTHEIMIEGTSTDEEETWLVENLELNFENPQTGVADSLYLHDQDSWNQGSYSGTSADRDAVDQGDLGIGYIDGNPDLDTTQPAVEDLELYWRMEDFDGDTVGDYSGNFHTGTVLSDYGGHPSLTPGVFDTDGTQHDGYASCEDGGDSEFPTDGRQGAVIDSEVTADEMDVHGDNPRTVSTWVKVDSDPAEDGGIFDMGTTDDAMEWSVRLRGTGDNPIPLRLQRWGGDLDFDVDASHGEWFHIAVTWDGDETRAYVNGEEVASDTVEPDTGTEKSFRVGEWYMQNDYVDSERCWNDGGYWTADTFYDGYFPLSGDVDEVMVYSDSLSDSEVEELYFHGLNNIYEGEYEIIERQGGPNVYDDIEINADGITGNTEATVTVRVLGIDPDFEPETSADSLSIDGEVHDYTVNVEPDGSYLRAWVDWDNDGNFVEEADFGTVGEGYGEGNFDNEGGFTLTDEIENPGGLDDPVHLLRITHKQALPENVPGEGPPSPDEGTGGWKGETLDFTLVTDPGIDPEDGNLTLGQGSFTITSLSAQDFQIEGDVLIDDGFTDDTMENPRFGPDGEFTLGGDQARLTEVSGIAHFVGFTFFEFPDLAIEIEYFGEEPEDTYIAAADECGYYP